MSTVWPSKAIKNKYDVYRGKDCMKKFCGSVKEHALKITNFKNKKMKLSTNEEQKPFETAKICYDCQE